MVGFSDVKNEEVVTVTTRTGTGIRTKRVLKSDIEAEEKGEAYKPKRVRAELTPFKDWTTPEKFLGITTAALALAAAYYGALYLAGSGYLPPEVSSMILNAHGHIAEATSFADNMHQTFSAINNGELDMNEALAGAAKIGEANISGTNRHVVNPIMEQFSKVFAPLNLGK